MTNSSHSALLSKGRHGLGPFGYPVDVSFGGSSRISYFLPGRPGDTDATGGVFSSWARAAVRAWYVASAPVVFKPGLDSIADIGSIEIRLIGLRSEFQPMAASFMASLLAAPGSVVPRALDDAAEAHIAQCPNMVFPYQLIEALTDTVRDLDLNAVLRLSKRSRGDMTAVLTAWAGAYEELTGNATIKELPSGVAAAA